MLGLVWNLCQDDTKIPGSPGKNPGARLGSWISSPLCKISGIGGLYRRSVKTERKSSDLIRINSLKTGGLRSVHQFGKKLGYEKLRKRGPEGARHRQFLW